MQKGHTWYVRLMVPKQHRELLGRTRYLVSLETRDKGVASKRKHAVLAELHRRMASELANLTGTPQSALGMLELAEWERRRVDSGEASQDEAEASFGAAVDGFLEAEARRKGRALETGHPLITEVETRVIRAAHDTIAGTGGLLLERAAEMYLDEIAPTVRNQTIREKRRGIDKLSKWLGAARPVKSVTKRVAGQYVTQVVMKNGLAPKTQRDEVGHLRAFFTWVGQRGEMDDNPFSGMSGSIRSSTRGAAPVRRPWMQEELVGLLGGISTNDPLWPMVAIAVYSGMRREEVVNLRVEDVAGRSWSVREGKTQSAMRTVPIHPVLLPLVDNLKATSSDGYLVSGLLSGGDDSKRGHLIGKRFGSMQERLGYDDRALNYHTLRNTFITSCEEVGLPPATVKLLVGHKRTDITFGLYSRGVSQELLQKAISEVSFGPLDDLVRHMGATVEVTMKSTRRRPRGA